MAKVKHPPAPGEMGEETARLRELPWQEKEKGRDERPTDQSADDDGDEDGGDHQHELVRSEPQDLNWLVLILGHAFVHRPFSYCYGPHQRRNPKARTRVRDNCLPVTRSLASVEPKCFPTVRRHNTLQPTVSMIVSP